MLFLFFQQIACGFRTEVEKEIKDGKVGKEACLGAKDLVVWGELSRSGRFGNGSITMQRSAGNGSGSYGSGVVFTDEQVCKAKGIVLYVK